MDAPANSAFAEVRTITQPRQTHTHGKNVESYYGGRSPDQRTIIRNHGTKRRFFSSSVLPCQAEHLKPTLIRGPGSNVPFAVRRAFLTHHYV